MGKHLYLSRAVALLLLLSTTGRIEGAYSKDRVRLADLQVFTAQRGHYTAARRVSPIPQLACVGGPAAGRGYEPSAVQCYNRGWDGRTVQWECKADLEDRVKFGSVHVLCEGFDFPGDEYILAGSCGVEYTLEYTAKGQGGVGSSSYDANYPQTERKTDGGSTMEWILLWLAVGIVIYALYVCVFSSGTAGLGENAYSRTDDSYPPPGGGGDFRAGAPPPPGFRSDLGGDGDLGYASCRQRPSGGWSNAFGGFWSGAAAGGMLGYMFGSRNRNAYGGYGYPYQPPPAYSAPSWSSPRRSSGGSGSSSTRSSSGFGGTTVR